ncbi:MAG: hypothetical protein K2X81_16970, partial [Candidatus Obscuribacterales bacterium]|nr:hypothetical protein [Candidatus Obscuribacterales bacterium]
TAPNVVVQGTLNITSSATTIPASLSVAPGQTLNIPPGNYNLNSLQVVNGGKITVDPGVQGQTQLFLNPQGNGQGTNGALYVDNTSSINMTGVTGGNGFTNTGISGFGPTLNKSIPAVNTSNPVQETSGSALNLVINSNASVNMLFAGNTRALVNAPNANINIGYQPYNGVQYTPNSKNNITQPMSNDANFYGAVIGGNVSVVSDYQSGAGAYFHYDVKLKQMSNQQQAGQPVVFNKPLGFYDPWTFASPGNAGGPAQGWRACSWQEQLGAW